MKHYLIEPKYKKSVVETSFFTKVIDEVKITAIREEGYRWGSFVISVESDDELPDPEDDSIDLEDYIYEMIDVSDGCWAHWSITSPDIDGKSNPDVIIENLYGVSSDELDGDTLYEDGWDNDFSDFSIQNGFTMKECDEGGTVL
jgi:hypothetical protein